MTHAHTPHTSHTLARARAVQLAREEAVHNKTVALLAERVKELEQLKSTLGASETQQLELTKALEANAADLEAKATELKTAEAEKVVLANEALAKQAEMKEAVDLVSGLEKELELEREQLGDAQKAKAQARWNLGAGKEKADAFNRKLKFQGGLRQQMVTKTVEERESLVEELVRERKEKEEMARMRVETVEQLKISLNSQIDAVLGNLKVEMGDAEQAATRKEAVEITKIALENKKASMAVASPDKPAAPKKSGSILGAIGGLFGMAATTEEGTEDEEATAAAASDDEAASEAAIKAAVSSMVSKAVASAAAEATAADETSSSV